MRTNPFDYLSGMVAGILTAMIVLYLALRGLNDEADKAAGQGRSGDE